MGDYLGSLWWYDVNTRIVMRGTQVELELEGWRCRDGSRSKCRSQEIQSVSTSWEGHGKNFPLEKFTWNLALAIR